MAAENSPPCKDAPITTIIGESRNTKENPHQKNKITFSILLCIIVPYAITSRADLNLRMAINETKLIRITEIRSTKAIEAAVEY